MTAQLVRADSGYHLWSGTYDRELHDLFKVQDEIANAVVQALQIKLAGGELSRRKGGTQNLDAYNLYLRAISSQDQLNKSSLDAAEAYLNQAIRLDPSYGKALAALARTVLSKAILALVPAEDHERARQLAENALQLSPDLVDARATLASLYMLWDRDWAAAETEAQRALAIDPANVDALTAAGQLSLRLGHWGDAERQLRAALARDPLKTRAITSLGDVYFHTGRFAEAEAIHRKVLELAPGSAWIHLRIGAALLLQGKPEAALAMVQQDLTSTRPLFLPIVLQANGRMTEADEALKALIAGDRSATFIAMNYAYRGDHHLALHWLERAYTQREPTLVSVGLVGYPLFRNIADDPRYKAFLRKMNLPE